MNKEQVTNLLLKIKANYQIFSIEDYVIEEWCNRLSKYNYDDVLKKLENYIEYAKEPPLINDLTESLNKINEDFKFEGQVICSKCGRKYKSIEEADKCYERDITLNQVNKYCNIFGLNKKQYFKNDTYEELNKNYDNFLLKIIEEQKKKPLLVGKDLQALRIYYKNVLRSKK